MTDLEWPVADELTEPASDSEKRRAGLSRNPGKRGATRLKLRSTNKLEPIARRTAILVIIGSTALLLHGSRLSVQGDATATVPPTPTQAANVAAAGVLNLPPPNLLKPLSAEEAEQENAERPFVKRPDTPAGKFVLKGDTADRDRATNCLTQAVYYEAAGEGVDGGRAVAQVVLNRMRHPGYPASVCGVVYQGADRTTGCQFTFTCDGSLLRTPMALLWERSRKIAQEALAGRVYAPIGHATHYHADYVLPYWADSLDKTIQIGRHIFYRLRSTPGDSRSFFQRYAGTEPLLPQPTNVLVIPPADVTNELAAALISDGVAGNAAEVEKASPIPASPLLVDTTRGTLLADGGVATPTQTRKTKAQSNCEAAGERKQLSPLGANDMRLSSGGTAC